VVKNLRGVAALLMLMTGTSAFCAQDKQPVFIYLFSKYSDFVNIEMTESRIHDTVSLVEKIRQKHPESQASVTMLFSGALSQALAERNAKTGIKDFLTDAARRGIIEMGYDGTDEPTYSYRPMATPDLRTPAEARWKVHGESAEQFLTESRDVASGRVQKGKSGGLKAMQEVFGEAVCVKGLNVGLGIDSEYVYHLRRLNTKAILWGLPDPNPALNIHGYRGSVEQFGLAMSPIPNSSPELNWVNHYLRLSETSNATVRVVAAQEGPEAIKKVVTSVDRSRVRMVHVELNDVRMYLSQFFDAGELFPPLKVAYNHPDHPNLPQEAFAEAKQLEEKQASQEALMQWLAGDFMRANAGSTFISSGNLAKMSPSDIGQSLSVAELQKAVASTLKAWGDNTYPPDYLVVGSQYLSLADTFQVLSDVLAEQSRTGRRPETVRLRQFYGPIDLVDEHGPASGSVTATTVARKAAELAAGLRDESWKAIPANAVPVWVDMDGLHLTAGQFLRLMAESLVAENASAPIKVKMTYSVSGSGMGYPKQRSPIEQGGSWTFKPAPLNLPGGARAQTAFPILAGR
jgi:hypothetical protein